MPPTGAASSSADGPSRARPAERCHQAIGTDDARGGTQRCASLRPTTSTMTWLGIGNVEGRVLSGDPSATRPKGSLALGNGVPGHELPRRENSRRSTVRPGDVLVLATDGIEAGLRGLARRSPARLRRSASGSWPTHWKPTDDALVVAVRYLGVRRMSATGAPERRRFDAAYASALGDYLRDPSETIASGRLRARARGGEPAAERARPGRRPPGGLAGSAARGAGSGGDRSA